MSASEKIYLLLPSYDTRYDLARAEINHEGAGRAQEGTTVGSAFHDINSHNWHLSYRKMYPLPLGAS
jgi:hypothetical protein